MRMFIAAAAVWSVAALPAGAAWAAEGSALRPGSTEKALVEKKINDEMSLRPREAKELMDRRKDLQLIDVRSPSEFAQGSLEGSANIPFINIMEGRHTLVKDKPILIVCTIGGRSYAAEQILLEQGYREVYNLDGGLANWQKERLPVSLQGITTK